jgi:hypothetical protein
MSSSGDSLITTQLKYYLVVNFYTLEETLFLYYDSEHKNFIPRLTIEGAAKMTLESAIWAADRLNTVCVTPWEVVEVDSSFISISSEQEADKA